MCRFFNGAYVLVAYKKNLYTPEFTLEAWVDIRWGQNVVDFEHTLFSAGGFYDMPFDLTTTKAFHGFRVFADEENRWQMRIWPSTTNVFQSRPLVTRDGKTHIAVTVQKDGAVGPNKKVVLYVDGKVTGIGTVGFYSLPEHAPLLIGVANGSNDPVNDPLKPTQPMLCLVQEVVLHSKALTQEEIENHVDINKIN